MSKFERKDLQNTEKTINPSSFFFDSCLAGSFLAVAGAVGVALLVVGQIDDTFSQEGGEGRSVDDDDDADDDNFNGL